MSTQGRGEFLRRPFRFSLATPLPVAECLRELERDRLYARGDRWTTTYTMQTSVDAKSNRFCVNIAHRRWSILWGAKAIGELANVGDSTLIRGSIRLVTWERTTNGAFVVVGLLLLCSGIGSAEAETFLAGLFALLLATSHYMYSFSRYRHMLIEAIKLSLDAEPYPMNSGGEA